MHVCVRSFVAFLIIGAYTDGFSLEAQLPVELGTPTVKFLDDVLGRARVPRRVEESWAMLSSGSTGLERSTP